MMSFQSIPVGISAPFYEEVTKKHHGRTSEAIHARRIQRIFRGICSFVLWKSLF